ncbi:Uncharacterized protein HZ326_22834 [Fusarium oxysporum f. sp. albedinis]|nr:Uncharacterized protein HZ326_22834 [Fusarium oxysporum f. sp. albedinis]
MIVRCCIYQGCYSDVVFSFGVCLVTSEQFFHNFFVSIIGGIHERRPTLIISYVCRHCRTQSSRQLGEIVIACSW